MPTVAVVRNVCFASLLMTVDGGRAFYDARNGQTALQRQNNYTSDRITLTHLLITVEAGNARSSMAKRLGAAVTGSMGRTTHSLAASESRLISDARSIFKAGGGVFCAVAFTLKYLMMYCFRLRCGGPVCCCRRRNEASR